MGTTRVASGHEAGILQDDPKVLAEAIADLVVQAAILDRATLEAAVGARAPGPPPVAPVIVRAWLDLEFRFRLLDDAFGACAEVGLAVPPMSPRTIVLDNTGATHHLIVCTLCSCHSRPLMGVPPAWYKSPEYRSRAVREPRAILAEFGLHLDPARPVHVQDASADLRYVVLPAPPEGWERATTEALGDTVTTEVLLGVALPRLA